MSAFVTSIISLDINNNNDDDPKNNNNPENNEGELVPPTTTTNNNNKDEVTAVLTCLDKAYLQKYVVDFATIPLCTMTITIRHNPFFLSAESVLEILQEEMGRCGRVVLDGAAEQVWDAPMLVEEEAVNEPNKAGIRPTVILSGVFWMISMLYYLGGNW